MPDPEDVAAAIARNTRKMRAEWDWTLERLSAESGISKGMLVQIEQARTNPSIGTLCRLAEAFGVTLAQIVELSGASSVRVVDADEVVRLWEGQEGSVADLLVGVDRREHVEVWRWRLAAGDVHSSEGHMEGTREMLAVLAGTLTLQVSGETHTVRAGGAVLFDADHDHAYRNEHRRALDMVLVVVQPTTIDRPSHPV